MATFGDNLRDLRSARAITLRELAQRTHYSHVHIHEVERGRKTPSLALAQSLDNALGSGGLLAALLAMPETPPVTPRPLTPDDVPGIHQTITHLAGLDTLHGADHLVDLGMGPYADRRARCATVTDTGVLAAVAELGQLAAWLAHDASRDEDCRRLLLESLALADAAAAPVRWLCLEQLAMLAMWVGRPAESLLYASRGLAEAPTPTVEGMLRMRRARALAELSPGADARREMEVGFGLLAAGPTAADPQWAWWLHEPEAHLHRAAVWSALGEHDWALTDAHAAVDGLPAGQVRDVVVYRGRAACAHAAAGDWGGVVEVAGETRPGSSRSRAELLRAGTGAPVGVREALAAVG